MHRLDRFRLHWFQDNLQQDPSNPEHWRTLLRFYNDQLNEHEYGCWHRLFVTRSKPSTEQLLVLLYGSRVDQVLQVRLHFRLQSDTTAQELLAAYSDNVCDLAQRNALLDYLTEHELVQFS